MSKQDPRLEKANREKYNALCAELGLSPNDAKHSGFSRADLEFFAQQERQELDSQLERAYSRAASECGYSNRFTH